MTNSEYLTIKEANHFKKALREEYETFKEEQKKIIKKLREEIKNLKSK